MMRCSRCAEILGIQESPEEQTSRKAIVYGQGDGAPKADKESDNKQLVLVEEEEDNTPGGLTLIENGHDYDEEAALEEWRIKDKQKMIEDDYEAAPWQPPLDPKERELVLIHQEHVTTSSNGGNFTRR